MFSRLFYLLARLGCWETPTRWISVSQPVPGRTGKSGAATIQRAARKRRKARR